MMRTMIAMLVCCGLNAQQPVIVTKRKKDGSTAIKWYLPGLRCDFPVYLVRTGAEGTKRLNAGPIRSGVLPTDGELADDPQLGSMIALCKGSPGKIEGIPMLALLLHSFRSVPLCRYLGIYFEDTVSDGGEARYRIFDARDSSLLCETASDGPDVPEQLLPPASITCRVRNQCAEFKWNAEPLRYYGALAYRSTDTAGSLITPGPLLFSARDSIRFKDGPLNPGRYRYTFRSIGFFNDTSGHSAEVTVIIRDLSPPKPPAGLRVSVNGLGVHLAWQPGGKESDLAGFAVFRTMRSDTDFVHLRTLMAADTSFTDTVPSFHAFFYKVRAMDNDSNVSFSNAVCANVFDNEPPQTPGLTAAGDSGRVVLSWSKSVSSDAAGYHLFRNIRADAASAVRITPSPVSCCAYRDSMPADIRTPFHYWLCAVDSSGNTGAKSEPARAVMKDVTPPDAPLVTGCAFVNNSVRITWMPNVERDISGYHVYRLDLDDSLPVPRRVSQRRVARSMTYFSDVLVAEGGHRYYIIAEDSSGNHSARSNMKYVSVPRSKVKPVQFASFKAKCTRRRHHVQLTWELAHEVPLRGFLVYRRAGDEPLMPVSGMMDGMQFTDRGTRTSTVYAYQVRAYGADGTVIRSGIVEVTTGSR